MWSNVLLISLLCICVATDIWKRKIYNAVLLPILCAAIVLQIETSGLPGLEKSLIGMAGGLGILLIPFLFGGMGAGDVKFLAVIGAIKGMTFVFMSALYMALAGGIMALLVILFHKGMKKRLQQLVYFIHGLLNGIRLPIFHDEEALKTTFPYGIAIAAGAFYQVLQAGGLQ